jgi:hypothetical protein
MTFLYVDLVRREATCDALLPRYRSWSGTHEKTSATLGTQLFKGYSLGRCTVLLCYSSITPRTALYTSNHFLERVRTDFPSTAQIPTAFALSTDNNIVGNFLSISCENVKDVSLLSVYGVPPNAEDVPDVREEQAHLESRSCIRILCYAS